MSTYRSKKYSFEKEFGIFFPLFSLLLLKCLLFFVLFVRWLLTCPFLEQKRVHTYWTVEHLCDISFTLSNYISRRERYYALLLFSLFSTKGGNKRSFRGEWCLLLRGMKKSFSFARAPESKSFNGKNDVYRKEEIKKNKIHSRMIDPTHTENTRRTSSYLRVTSLLETVAFKRTD